MVNWKPSLSLSFSPASVSLPLSLDLSFAFEHGTASMISKCQFSFFFVFLLNDLSIYR